MKGEFALNPSPQSSLKFPELALTRQPDLAGVVRYFETLRGRPESPVRAIHHQSPSPGTFRAFPGTLQPALQKVLRARRIEQLYSHQAEEGCRAYLVSLRWPEGFRCPLDNEVEYDRLDVGDIPQLRALRQQIRRDGQVEGWNATKRRTFTASHALSKRQIEVLFAGGLIRWVRARL